MNMCTIWTHQIGYLVIQYCNDKNSVLLFVPLIQLHKSQKFIIKRSNILLNASTQTLNIIQFSYHLIQYTQFV